MRLFTENLALKGVSLALACGLWFVIAAETTSEIGLSIPLEMRNVPRNLELTGDPADNVEVRLRASPGIIHALTPADVSAQVDLTAVTEGERVIHLTPDSIRVPFGVKVVKISPATLILRFEETGQRDVPIRPRLAGHPAPGYEVADIATRPVTVRISGPRSRVSRVESAFTEPVQVEGARATISVDRNLGLEDPLLRILGNPSVRVTVEVREEEKTRIFESVPVATRGGEATLRPSGVRIVIAGPTSLVEKLEPGSFRPYVDLAGIVIPGPVQVTVEILPGHTGLRVESVEPREVLARPARKKKG
jgi:YbbR domain-containing protein